MNDDSLQGNLFSTRCTCGKNVKDPSKIACTTARCPCNKQSQACSRKCRCYNCKNETNTKFVRPSGIKTRRRNGGPCACGKNSPRKIQTVCRAKMAKEKWSVHVLKKESDAPRGANAATAEIRSKQEFALHWAQEENEEEKRYPATRENVELNFWRAKMSSWPRDHGDWWKRCLIVCEELLVFNELPINSLNVATLYNFVAVSDKLEELSARKSTAQVSAKIKHLTKTQHEQIILSFTKNWNFSYVFVKGSTKEWIRDGACTHYC